MRKEILTMFNGNKQEYKKVLPRIYILDGMNDVAKGWIEKQTGLILEPAHLGGYTAQPKKSQQITKLFLTYNFKTRYYDNASTKNTMFLKFAHDQDWDKNGIARY
jgi:hypothetical protein